MTKKKEKQPKKLSVTERMPTQVTFIMLNEYKQEVFKFKTELPDRVLKFSFIKDFLDFLAKQG